MLKDLLWAGRRGVHSLVSLPRHTLSKYLLQLPLEAGTVRAYLPAAAQFPYPVDFKAGTVIQLDPQLNRVFTDAEGRITTMVPISAQPERQEVMRNTVAVIADYLHGGPDRIAVALDTMQAPGDPFLARTNRPYWIRESEISFPIYSQEAQDQPIRQTLLKRAHT